MPITNQTYTIGDTVDLAPDEFRDLTLKINFNTNEVELTSDNITLSNKAASVVTDRINSGLNGGVGIFEGLTYKQDVSQGSKVLNIFNGYLDLQDNLQKINSCRYSTSIKVIDDKLSFTQRLEGNSWAYLLDTGVVVRGDIINIPMVIQKKEYGLEFAILAITTFITAKETAQGVASVVDSATDLIKAVTPGFGAGLGAVVTTDVGDIIALAILLAARVAYTAVLIIQLKLLLEELLDYIYPPIRNLKGMRVRRMMEIMCEFQGYELDIAEIDNLDSLSYLPSRQNEDSDLQGIPSVQDRGMYRLIEAWESFRELFRFDYVVCDNKVIVRPLVSEYWNKNSEYTQPSIRIDTCNWNTSELFAYKNYSFRTDPRDVWTTESFRGTNLDVITEPIRIIDPKKVGLTGFDETTWTWALGERKNSLNDLERFIRVVATGIDRLVNFFGGSSNLASRVENRVGNLILENRTYSVNKLLALDSSGKMLSNHRDIVSARSFYEKYHRYDSFVLDNFLAQKFIFENQEWCISFEDICKIVKNKRFTDCEGKEAEFEEIEWNPFSKWATCSYKSKSVYTKNLKEVYVEPR